MAHKPAFCDELKREAIMNGFRLGCSKAAVAKMVGVSYETMRLWFQKGTETRQKIYNEFVKEAQDAIRQGMMRRLLRIDKAAVDSWQADAWMLERMHPDLFGKPQARVEVNQQDDNDDGENGSSSKVVIYIPDNGRD